MIGDLFHLCMLFQDVHMKNKTWNTGIIHTLVDFVYSAKDYHNKLQGRE